MSAAGPAESQAGLPGAPGLSRRRRLLFWGVAAVLFFGAAEVLLQAYYYITAGEFLFRRVNPPIYATDPVRCYGLAPNLDYTHTTNEFSVRILTNAQGFRTGPERETYSYEKEPGTYRILLLGPSFAFGWGNDYEDSFAVRLREGLAARGQDVELINLGTPAQGPTHQLCWLEAEGYRFQPDLVLQTDYGGLGKVRGECPEQLDCPVIANGRLYTQTPTLRRRIIHRVKNFALVFYGYYVVQAFGGAPEADGEGIGKELYDPASTDVDETDLAAVVAPYLRYVDFVQATVGNRTDVVFLHIPMSFVVHPGDARRWSHLLDDTDPFASRARNHVAATAVRDAGIALIDTTPVLVEAAAAERLYYWLDIHLTPAGNRVVAEAALAELIPLVEARSVKTATPARGTGP